MSMQHGFQNGSSRPVAARTRNESAPATQAFMGSNKLTGTPMPFSRNTQIYGESEPADYLYKVVSGVIRTYRVLADGRRQIGGFYLPGDFFGLEVGDDYTFSADAIADSKVLAIKRSALTTLATHDNEVAQLLWKLTATELQHVQDHTLLLVETAQERVSGFLMEMAKRALVGNQIELPMSRQDIADYLGLTIETVSRTLTHLEKTSAIELPSSRVVVLLKRSTLNQLDGSTRYYAA